MVEPMLIDLRALMVEREDCDAGTVQQLRNALAQGGNQYRALRDVTDILRTKLESASGAPAKKWHLKLGIALFFLVHTHEAVANLAQAEGALASCYLAEGERLTAVKHLEKAVELDPNHTGALFQLGHANDLAGNDEEAISYYERCLNHPPVHVGALNNLGVLYEDNEKYGPAVECYRRILGAEPTHERARLFFKDAQASQTMYYSPEEEHALSRFSQVLEIPVTDFELSVRSRNCLKKMNIRTLGDLTRVTEQQLLSSKNFGETSLQEIKEMMATKGLRLGQSLEDGGHQDLRYRTSQPLSAEEQAVLNKPVTDLNLSVRARKCMNRLNINTLGDLVQRTADELLEAKNFGMTSLTEVRERLTQYNLKLRGD